MVLKVKNKISFVNGAIAQPIVTDDPLYSLWKMCNNMVLSWILKKKLLYMLRLLEKCGMIWKISFAKAMGLGFFKSKMNFHCWEQTSISAYYQNFKCLWDEFMNYNHMPNCTCGAYQNCTCRAIHLFFEYQQHQHVMMFLMGLNEDFSHIRGQILLLEHLSSTTKVYSWVV